jgi:hypothetical protein
MPNSFSRFLSPSELAKVREVYLESLDRAGSEDAEGADQAPDGPPEPSGDLVDG